MAETASKKNKTLYQQIGFSFRKKPEKCYNWSIKLEVLELGYAENRDLKFLKM
jgi:hypothetical protein